MGICRDPERMLCHNKPSTTQIRQQSLLYPAGVVVAIAGVLAIMSLASKHDDAATAATSAAKKAAPQGAPQVLRLT